MQYRFAEAPKDYSDYSSGRVFYGLPGHPAFPVRLASEIFQRCLAIRSTFGVSNPCCLYDPCCGGAYHLSVLGYLHWNDVDEIIASDVDEKAVSLAQSNLALLTVEGIDRRIAEISQMFSLYGKSSHAAALESAEMLRDQLLRQIGTHTIKTDFFRADATNNRTFIERFHSRKADIVFTDIPYGQRSQWQVTNAIDQESLGPVWQMLEAVRPILSSNAVAAIVAPKRQKIFHERYQRIERFQVGKRQIVLLQQIYDVKRT
ncbi:hypothetical protein ACFL6S_19970 [Candidatus Poribacteria bacterium]